jgi:hypothetical protein
MKFGELNDKPFSHTGQHGTELKASRCDFSEGYVLYRPENITDEQFATDVGMILHWHAINVCPELNGYYLRGCKKILREVDLT